MARALIECVPNFSEGRRPEVIEAIVAPFRATSGVYLFDYRADEVHNRLVVSLVGHPEETQNALIEASLIAKNNINMNSHEGAHPRIGAVDVIPFTPISSISMQECVVLAHSFGERYFRETGIPVYYYEDAAKIPERVKLETIRKGQYETLKDEAGTKPERTPDIGGPGLHETAGASVIGARKFLVAFNINLGTTDVSVAKEIAKFLRASSGGFCHVKGIGLALNEKGMVQVSMNLVDYEKNSIYRVLEMARMEARRWGVSVVETEIYGMVPAAAMLESTSYYLQSIGFDASQVLELKLLQMMMEEK